MTSKPKVWRGPPALRRSLVPISSLEPFPGNPRRGDIAAIAESLGRFGQRRHVLTELADPASGAYRLVAGHNVVIAARELLDWTHIAIFASAFDSEDEARAYLLADNRTSELGGIDKDALAVQLAALSDFTGTGYTEEDRQQLAGRLALLRDLPDPPKDVVVASHKRTRPDASAEALDRELLDRETNGRFSRHVAMLRREWGLETTSEVVARAVREAAERA